MPSLLARIRHGSAVVLPALAFVGLLIVTGNGTVHQPGPVAAATAQPLQPLAPGIALGAPLIATATPHPVPQVALSAFDTLALQPDIVVDHDYQPFDDQGRQMFTLINIGDGAAKWFHVSVQAGRDSYGFLVTGLPAHSAPARAQYSLRFQPTCGEAITVIADNTELLDDADRSNNTVTFYGACDG